MAISKRKKYVGRKTGNKLMYIPTLCFVSFHVTVGFHCSDIELMQYIVVSFSTENDWDENMY